MEGCGFYISLIGYGGTGFYFKQVVGTAIVKYYIDT